MSRTDPQLKIRLEPELHRWVKAQADANRRSMSAEIAARLDELRRTTTTEEQTHA